MNLHIPHSIETPYLYTRSKTPIRRTPEILPVLGYCSTFLYYRARRDMARLNSVYEMSFRIADSVSIAMNFNLYNRHIGNINFDDRYTFF